jgi:hypothetical protein
MYDLTLNIDSENNGLTYIEPGINENLRLAKPDGSYPIVYEKSKSGSEFIAFHFMNEQGQTFVHTEWIPKSDDSEVLAKKEANLAKRIRHIGKKFVDESLLKRKVETFEQLAKLVISAIGDNYKGKLFRCKVIYNNKNFTTFPNYIPFIESMDIPKEKSKLKMSGDDKVVKSKPDAVVSSSPTPFMATSPSDIDDINVPSSEDINQLPF